MSAEAIAIAAVGVTLPGVLVPLLLTIRGAIAELRADVGELRRELHALGKRVARIEGTLGGLAPSPAPPAPSVEDLTQRLTEEQTQAIIARLVRGAGTPVQGDPAGAPETARRVSRTDT